jgi:hypothetical protein
MAWILPAFGISAVNLWHKKNLGYTMAGALLSFLIRMILAIAGMVVVEAREGMAFLDPLVVIFAVLSAITLGLLIWYMKCLRLPPG